MNKKMKGLSLVELMVATVISLLLGVAMVTLFISNKKAYTESERFARMQDNARHAIYLISEDLRLVDFWGEARANDIVEHSSITGLTITNDCTSTSDAAVMKYNKALWSTNSGNSSSNISGLNCISQGDVLQNTDILALKHASGSVTTVSDNNTYLIANPTTAILFHKTGSNAVPSTGPTGVVANGTIRNYIYNNYYINDSSSTPSLDRKTLNGTSLVNEKIADGVENFRILFGIDSDLNNEVDRFVSSSDVSDWSKVMSMRIFLLMRSAKPDHKYTDNKTYILGDVSCEVTPSSINCTDPDDTAMNLGDVSGNNENHKFHRTVVSSTVTLRNPQIVLKGGF